MFQIYCKVTKSNITPPLGEKEEIMNKEELLKLYDMNLEEFVCFSTFFDV